VSDTIDVRVPDIGDFKDVPVIEVLVKPGDRVKKNDSLVTLESDKASMEVPSVADGVVAEIKVRVGDKVSEGTTIVVLRDAQDDNVARNDRVTDGEADALVQELRVPDLGDFKDVPVIEVLVKPGDTVSRDASLVTLESDKASMDVPAITAGRIKDVFVKVGDKVNQGTVLATVLRAGGTPSVPASQEDTTAAAPPPAAAAPPPAAAAPAPTAAASSAPSGIVHASPAIRKFARELGVDLRGLGGSGPHGRVTREDVQRFVKSALAAPAASGGFGIAGLPAWPSLDFSAFGPTERAPLSRIKKLSGPNLHRNWLQIPHITNYDEADVTDLEAFRNEINAEAAKSGGAKLTMLAFLVKACVAALQRFPEFNSSLDGDALILKRYYNIGFAADTPNGLIVPVVKNADGKGLLDIARESAELAAKARDGKLGLGDMQGGTFTISSIGGIGGTAFTQIVNAPEVAILGATRAATKPVWDGAAFVPRLILPISVSYDHRVIDGAGAARFLVYLASLLRDFRRVLL
jgi:pyruvate dehydrogenase E2 component (dihydrolipoamide acetyltransferase)